jgi:uncharacterized membrane protein
MTEVERHVDVECPLRTVYNQYTQFEEFPRFMSGVERVTQLDDRHLHWVIEIGGLKREFDAEITEQQPDERIAWRSIDGKTHGGLVTFRSVGDGRTRVTVRMAYDPEGFAENAADALGIISSRIEGDLQRFKSFIESRGRETGAWRGEIGGAEGRPTGQGTMGATHGAPGIEPTARTGTPRAGARRGSGEKKATTSRKRAHRE